MVKKNFDARLAAAERRLGKDKPVVQEVIVRGGLVSGIFKQAIVDGELVVHPEPDESFVDFQQRVRSLGQTQGAKWIVFGGLPADPINWATPPGMEEALAAAGRHPIDEIDS